MVIFLFLLYLTSLMLKMSSGELEDDISKEMNNTRSLLLSRRKRYLIFPEGSSLQLVFCLTVPTIGQSGRVLTIGGTAALAWELPTEPYKKKFGKHDDKPKDEQHPEHEDKDDASSDWSSKNQHMISASSAANRRRYYNSLLFNKVTNEFYKTINRPMKNGFTYIKNNSAGRASQTKRRKSDYNGKGLIRNGMFNEPVTTYVHPVYHQIHRRTRRQLYGKIEKFFIAQRKDGKACLLKAICEVSQSPKQLGTFFEEIMKTIFSVKPHKNYADEDDYDKAANKNHNCTEQYPTCESSVWNAF